MKIELLIIVLTLFLLSCQSTRSEIQEDEPFGYYISQLNIDSNSVVGAWKFIIEKRNVNINIYDASKVSQKQNYNYSLIDNKNVLLALSAKLKEKGLSVTYTDKLTIKDPAFEVYLFESDGVMYLTIGALFVPDEKRNTQQEIQKNDAIIILSTAYIGKKYYYQNLKLILQMMIDNMDKEKYAGKTILK